MTAIRCRGVIAAVLLVAAILAFAVSAAAAPARQGARATQTFTYTGNWQSVEVPAGVNAVTVMLLGGHGGSSGRCNGNNGPIAGGEAAQVSGRIAVRPGEQLRVGVGGFGGDGDGNKNPGAGGWGPTGRGGRGGGASTHDGGGGGGASEIQLGGTAIAIAGGGGGGGGTGSLCSLNAGGAGGSTGGTVEGGEKGVGVGSGGGGSGAARGDGAGGGGGNGSTGGGAGAGGGAGYRGGDGGGGGKAGGGGGGGGGGGSSLLGTGLELASVAHGGGGTDGRVEITWQHLTPPSCVSEETVSVPYDSQGVSFSVECGGGTAPSGFRVVQQPRDGELTQSDPSKGSFTYVPTPGRSGVDTMKFVATAAGLDSPVTTVRFVVAPGCLDQTVNVPTDSTGVPVQLHCSNTDAARKFEIVATPRYGNLDDRDLDAGTFSYAPLEERSGADQLKFKVDDGGVSSATAIVNFEVGPAGAPVCADQTGVARPGRTRFQLSCPALGSVSRYAIVGLPAHGHLVAENLTAGTVSYVPEPGYRGPDSFLFQAFQGGRAAGIAKVSLEVKKPIPPMDLTVGPTTPGEMPTLTVTMPKNADGIVGFYTASHTGLGTAPIHEGVARLRLADSVPPGSYVIHGSFGGDANWDPNDSNPVAVDVGTVTRAKRRGPAKARVIGTDEFAFIGEKWQHATVPAEANVALLEVVGAHGGHADACGASYAPGGDAAKVTGRLAVVPGQELRVGVGGYGGDGHTNESPGVGGWGGTGHGGRGGSSSTRDGGGGGGASAVERGGQVLVVAGAGGGGGGSGSICAISEDGGAGGAAGETGESGGHLGGGEGGRGGARADGHGGTGGHGTDAAGAAGGGGAGYRGGEGGEGGSTGGGGGGGGGGGSSFTSEDIDLTQVSTADIRNGHVLITWEHLAPPTCVADKQVDVPYESGGVSSAVDCSGGTAPSAYRVVQFPRRGELTQFDPRAGTFTYKPTPGLSGLDTMKFVATGGGLTSAEQTVRFVVFPGCLDQAVHVPTGSAGAPLRLHCSRDNQGLTYRLVSSTEHGHLDDRDPAAGTLTYVPLSGFAGSDRFRFVATSGSVSSAAATVTLDVGPTAPPSCAEQSGLQVREGHLRIHLHCPALGSASRYAIVELPSHGHLVAENLAAGTLTYVPEAGYLGPDSFLFQAFQGGSAAGIAKVSLEVKKPIPPMELSVNRPVPGTLPLLTVTMPASATGIVGFYDSSHGGLGTAPLVNGVAKLTVPAGLPPGRHVLHASYGGDGHWDPNDSNTVTVVLPTR